ncbi:pyridoxal phosphate-dependent transferase [Dichotomopilus funicola]|uniref:Pyridoxal phosphate-dependent transferase n=1 Tax=Dichotomopilus funicola TaxID=1934379 RepID=A0AAN6V1K7_9PEZI|nr:pyridoxal phosphate-dependent transferase [Dichotomopilus funicola]
MRFPLKAPARSLLWRSLRVYQVYGANTEVGKTVVTTLLCKAARRLWKKEETGYVKPVSTGAATDADDLHIRRFAPGIPSKTLFQYDLAVSPHIAAEASKKFIPSDEILLNELSISASQQASRGPGWLFIETAGGVHSPGPSGSTQADLYRPLRLPVVLIGDSKLGGISQTISAFESLKIRGYDVDTVMLFSEPQYQNYQYLTQYFKQEHDIPVASFSGPPRRMENDTTSDVKNMSQYYEDNSKSETFQDVLNHLNARHQDRIARLESMSTKASDIIWYPFTQQKHLTKDKITVIDSAHGDCFETLIPETQPQESTTPVPSSPPPTTALLQPSFDGSASWWTQGLGHGNPKLALTAAYAAGRYGHVMFAEAVHEPALALAETLLAGLQNPRLSRVFYSDNGSTAVEVAVKMALRAARVRYGWDEVDDAGRLGVLGLRGSYHGDTVGAMDCSEPCVYNEKVEWYEGRGYWLDYPVVEYSGGTWVVRYPSEMVDPLGESGGRSRFEYASVSAVFDVEGREKGEEGRFYEDFLTATLKRLVAEGHKFGALMLEPVVLGAGGMLLVDPLFQRTLVKVVRQHPSLFGHSTSPQSPSSSPTAWTGLPVIFDEVFTGLYRLGRFSAASYLGVNPDISVHAKLLTGGLLPLSVTLASEDIFQAFSSDDKSDALLHGHSYTAHAVGCQVALESVKEMQQMEGRGDWEWAKGPYEKEVSEVSTTSASPGKDNLAWSVWSPEFIRWVDQLPSGFVSGIWALGSVLAIRIASADGVDSYKSNAARVVQAALLRGDGTDVGVDGEKSGDISRWNVHTRVLGNTLYVMTGQKTTGDSVWGLESLLRRALEDARKAGSA